MKKLFNSFKYALMGIIHTFKNESNFVIQIIICIIVILAGFFFQITSMEWIIVLLLSAFVLSLELINTAFEILVDLTAENYHELAKKAKDVAAASVFLMSLFAAVIGFLIFYPYFLEMIK